VLRVFVIEVLVVVLLVVFLVLVVVLVVVVVTGRTRTGELERRGAIEHRIAGDRERGQRVELERFPQRPLVRDRGAPCLLGLDDDVGPCRTVVGLHLDVRDALGRPRDVPGTER